MREVFHEETALVQDERAETKKYNLFNVLSIISYVLVLLWVTLVFYGYQFKGDIFVNLIFVSFPIILFVLLGVLFGKIKNKFHVEYDYTFINGNLRIDKIINKLKRKSVITFDTDTIEKIGLFDSETYKNYNMMQGIERLVLTSNTSPEDGKYFYYIVANVKGSKKLMIFECTDFLIHNIRLFANKAVFEEELIRR